VADQDVDVSFSRHLGGSDRESALAADARAGLTAHRKGLPPKWFYDAEGSRLFDEVTRQPEYYLTRAEREILAARAAEIAELSGADTIVELGSGTSEKTRLLLTALAEADALRRFIPFDVDETILTEAAAAITQEFPGVSVHAVVGDFERHLPLLPRGGCRMIALLGSTIGNLSPRPRGRFLADVRSAMDPGDTLLLGVDLLKDPARIVPAYDDSAGVGVRYSRNMLRVLNNELGGDFDVEAFDHVARWDADNEWLAVGLRANRAQRVRLEVIDLVVDFAAGEEMHNQISTKFRRDVVEAELASAGLEPVAWWTDVADDFGLSLSRAGDQPERANSDARRI
jgi:L-histidine N-alpha-methyltransferase